MSRVHVDVAEGQGFYALATFRKADGTVALQADVQTVTAFVYLPDTKTPISQESYAVTDSVFDTIQTDGYWDVDTSGYNFRGRVRSELFTVGSGRYELELVAYLWNDQGTAEPDLIPKVYEVDVTPLRSS